MKKWTSCRKCNFKVRPNTSYPGYYWCDNCNDSEKWYKLTRIPSKTKLIVNFNNKGSLENFEKEVEKKLCLFEGLDYHTLESELSKIEDSIKAKLYEEDYSDQYRKLVVEREALLYVLLTKFC